MIGAVLVFTDQTERMRAEADARARLRDSERRANTDVLTGIGNRRHAQGFLSAVVDGDAVVLIDVDHFKSVNDQDGHDAGDEVLRDLARHLASALRVGDEVARYGGEEFLVLLSGAGYRAEQVLERIAGDWNASGARPTFSAGIAVHRAGTAPQDTVGRADRALYQAKHSGRNRIVTEQRGNAAAVAR